MILAQTDFGKIFQDNGRYILIGGIILFMIILFIILYFSVISHNRMKKQTRDLEKKYNNVHEVLTVQVEQAINRIYFISQKNMEYVSTHEKYIKAYENILETKDKQSYIAINSLKSLVLEKKFRGLKSIIDSTKITIMEFSKSVEMMNDELSEILLKDEDCRLKAVELQRRLRLIKEVYASHETELKSIEHSFQRVFEKIDKNFQEFEELNNSAKYQEALEKLPVMQKVLDALQEQLEKLPSYCAIVTNVLPNRIEELEMTFKQLESQNYPLHHLKVNAAIEDFNNKLEDLKNRLSMFKMEKISEDIQEIEDRIVILLRDFEDEKEAKVFFDNKCETIYEETYVIEKQFMKLKRVLPTFKSVYLLKDRYLDDIEQLQIDIDNLGNIKRDLDNYIHSSTRQPYSILMKKLNDLDKETMRIKETITEFHHYLNSLKKDSESSYEMIKKYFIDLKKAEAVVRDMDVPTFKDTLKNDFDRSYAYLESIGDLIKVQPIDVQTINETAQVADSLIEDLLKRIQEQSAQRKYAEESIVYANQYRQEFYDVKQSLIRAERSFYEGDFGRTIDETVKTIKKMRPDVSK